MNTEEETDYYTELDVFSDYETTNQWVYFEKTVMVPSNIKRLNIRIESFWMAPGHVWFDDIQMKQVGSEIVEENNYYPFGLKHKGYNSQVTGTHHNWDFQGQEYTEDFGLNIHEWKYRISDPTIGRFWQIDPLAEDYMYNGVYNFAENRIIDSAELEGLERIYAADGKFISQVGDSQEIRVMYHSDGNSQGLINTANNTKLSSEERAQAVSILNDNSFHGFSNTDEAAGSFAYTYNAESVERDVEAGATIHEIELTDSNGNSEGLVSILSPVKWGNENSREINVSTLEGPEVNAFGNNVELQMPGKKTGFVHTHGKGSNDFSSYNGFGGGDKGISKSYGVPVYMSNKRGELKVFKYNNNGPHTKKIIRNNIPTKKRN